jgi:hypothetical protein
VAKTGMRVNSKEQQRINAELEAIIEEFGRAMRDAHKPFIAGYVPSCSHDEQLALTPHMKQVWCKYREWCVNHGKKA